MAFIFGSNKVLISICANVLLKSIRKLMPYLSCTGQGRGCDMLVTDSDIAINTAWGQVTCC